MELWVRSQDKILLVPITGAIGLKYNDYTQIIANYIPDFTDKYEDGYYDELGKYKTKERALEVLDEIQNILKPKYILNASSIKQNGDYYEKNGKIYQDYSADARIEQLNIYVYEMPEE